MVPVFIPFRRLHCNSGGMWNIEYATCAKLLNYPDKAGIAGATLQPEVAESMPTVSNGDKTYTFTVRDGFKFSPPSGALVTAMTIVTVFSFFRAAATSASAGKIR